MGARADRIAAKLRRGVESAAKALVLEINRELRLKPPLGTPVMDGNARANWIPSVGAPAQGTPSSVAEGNAAAAAGTAAVAAFKLGQGDLYITNRTPYIRRLNDGYSKQSPALFVEAAVERAKTKIKARTGVDFGGVGLAQGTSAGDAASSMAGNLASAYSPFGGSE